MKEDYGRLTSHSSFYSHDSESNLSLNYTDPFLYYGGGGSNISLTESSVSQQAYETPSSQGLSSASWYNTNENARPQGLEEEVQDQFDEQENNSGEMDIFESEDFANLDNSKEDSIEVVDLETATPSKDNELVSTPWSLREMAIQRLPCIPEESTLSPEEPSTRDTTAASVFHTPSAAQSSLLPPFPLLVGAEDTPSGQNQSSVLSVSLSDDEYSD